MKGINELRGKVEAYIKANYPAERQERLLIALDCIEEGKNATQ